MIKMCSKGIMGLKIKKSLIEYLEAELKMQEERLFYFTTKIYKPEIWNSIKFSTMSQEEYKEFDKELAMTAQWKKRIVEIRQQLKELKGQGNNEEQRITA